MRIDAARRIFVRVMATARERALRPLEKKTLARARQTLRKAHRPAMNPPIGKPRLITMPDGRQFPTHDGVTPLSWPVGSHFTLQDEREGYPRVRAVLAAYPDDRLEKERNETVRDSFDRLFGHNAKRLLVLIDEEIARRRKRNPRRGPTLTQAIDARMGDMLDAFEGGYSEMTGKLKIRHGSGPGSGEVIGRYGGVKSAFPELAHVTDSPGVIAKAIRRGKGKVYSQIRRSMVSELGKLYSDPRKRRAEKPTVPGHKGRKYCTHCRVMHGKNQHRFHGAGAFHKTHLFSFNPPYARFFKTRSAAETHAKKLLAKGVKSSPVEYLPKYGMYRVAVPSVIPSLDSRKANPSKKLVKIYGRVLTIHAEKVGPHRHCDAECKRANHKSVHDFKRGARMYGLPDGSILISDRER